MSMAQITHVQPANLNNGKAFARLVTFLFCPMYSLAMSFGVGYYLWQRVAYSECVRDSLGRTILQYIKSGGRGR
jgi:hypothetical protein